MVAWIHRLSGICERLLSKSPPGDYRQRLVPNLFVRQLEERRVLSAAPLSPNDGAEEVTLDAGTFADDGIADTFEVVRQADEVEVSVNGSRIFSRPLTEVQKITLSGSGDDDVLIVDYSGGDPFPAGGIFFDGMGQSDGIPGQSGEDSLRIVGRIGNPSYGGTIDTVTHRFDRVGEGLIRITMQGEDGLGTASLAAGGTVSLAAGGTVSTLAYAGVESVHDASGARNLRFQLSAAAETVTISDGGDGHDGELTIRSSLASSGATGGVLEVEGTIISKGGTVHLDAGSHGTLLLSGTIDVSNADVLPGEGGQTGGTVHLLGDRVALLDGARVDASGDAGGGTILIGGDYQGGNPQIRNASRTFVGPQATIAADALTSGSGGTVVVWSEEVTRFFGDVTARGGTAGGDGGLVETSGKHFLEVVGASVDASAPCGVAGIWLLDPRNVEIRDQSSVGGSFNGGAANLFTPTADDAVADRNVIQASLNRGTNVIVTTGATGSQDGNITVVDSITKDSGGNARLTLEAAKNLIVDAAIESTAGTLDVVLNADSDNNGSGVVHVHAAISTNGGVFSSTGAGFSAGGQTIDVGPGSVAIDHAGTVILGSIFAGGNLDVTADGWILDAASPIIDVGGTATLTAEGKLIILGGDPGGRIHLGMLNATADTVVVMVDSTITLGTINATRFELSSAGAIRDGNADANNVTGSDVILIAAHGIGDSADGLEMSVSRLEAAGGSGGVFVANTGPLTIGGIDTISGIGDIVGISSGGGGIDVSASSPLTINEAVVDEGGGDIRLTAANDGGSDDHLTINAPVRASGGNGHIVLEAGTDLIVNGAQISAVNGGTITANSGRNTQLTAGAGVISAGGAIAFTTDDLYLETVSTPATINAAAGTVTIRNASGGRRIDLGTDTPGWLGLSAAELGRITAGTLRIGRNDAAATGEIHVSHRVELTDVTTLHLLSGGTVWQSAEIVVSNLAVESAGDVTLTNVGNNVDVLAAEVTGAGSSFSYTDTDELTIGGVATVAGISAAGGNVTLTCDDIIIAENYTVGSDGGTLVLQPTTADRSIGIGDNAAGDYHLDTAEIGRLLEGFSEIRIGREDGSHDVTIGNVNDPGDIVRFKDAVTISSPFGGSIAIHGQFDTLGNTDDTDPAWIAINGSGATTTLAADIITASASVTIDDSVLVHGTPTIRTTGADDLLGGAAIRITGPIDGYSRGGTDTLTLDAASVAGSAAVTITNDVEGGAGAESIVGGEDLEGLTIEGGQIDVASIRVEGPIELVLLGGAGGSIHLHGTTYRTDENGGNETIDFHGPVRLNNDVVVTSAGGTGDTITFDGIVNSDGQARSLEVQSGDAAVTIRGDVGSLQRLGGFDVDSTGGAITLGGDISTQGGHVDFSGVTGGRIDVTDNDHGDFVIDTEDGTGSLGAGNVDFGDARLVATDIALIFDARDGGGIINDDGDVTLPSSIRTADGVIVHAERIRAGSIVTTGGPIELRSTATSGEAITLTGNILDTTDGGSTAAGAIVLRSAGGRMLLDHGGNTVTFRTDGIGTNDASITIDVAIDANAREPLTLLAGTGAGADVYVNAPLGATAGNELGRLTIVADEVLFGANVSAAGISVRAASGVDINAPVTLDIRGSESFFESARISNTGNGTIVDSLAAVDGTMIYRPLFATASLNVGDDAPDSNVSDAAVAAVSGSVATLQIGYAVGQLQIDGSSVDQSQSGTLTFDGAGGGLTVPTSLIVQAADADVDILDNIDVSSGGDFAINGSGATTAIHNTSTISTDGGAAIAIHDGVSLAEGVTLTLDSDRNRDGHGGAVSIDGHVRGDGGGNEHLAIIAGDGSVTLGNGTDKEIGDRATGQRFGAVSVHTTGDVVVGASIFGAALSVVCGSFEASGHVDTTDRVAGAAGDYGIVITAADAGAVVSVRLAGGAELHGHGMMLTVASDVVFGSAVSSTGAVLPGRRGAVVRIEGTTSATSFGLGNDGAGDVQISQRSLSAVDGTFDAIVIGNTATFSGQIEILDVARDDDTPGDADDWLTLNTGLTLQQREGGSGEIHLASSVRTAGDFVVNGSYRSLNVDGGGGGTITLDTSGGDLVIHDTIIFVNHGDDLAIVSSGGDVSLLGSISSAEVTANADGDRGEDITITAGAGNILLGRPGDTFGTDPAAAVDRERLGTIRIVSASDVTVQAKLGIGEFRQDAGAGTTQFHAPLDLRADNGDNGASATVLTITNVSNVVFDDAATVHTGGGGAVVLDGDATGRLTIGTGAFTLDGSFLQQESAVVSIGANITTTGDDVTFRGNAIVLTENVTIDTGTAAGDILFANRATIDNDVFSSPHGLTLSAGTGSVSFNADIGAVTPIGSLTVTRADGGISFGLLPENSAGTPGIDLGPVTTVATEGPIHLGSLDVIRGGIKLDGGQSTITASSAGGNVRFNGPVELRSDVRIDTGTGSGNITFTADAPIDSVPGEANRLVLDAGTGDIDFFAAIGGNERLGDLQIVRARNVNLAEATRVTRFAQHEGSGTTTLAGPLDTISTPWGVDVKTSVIIVNAAIVTNGGSLDFHSAGLVQLHAPITTGGGAVDVNAGGAISMSDGTVVHAGDGTIALRAGGDIELASVQTDNATDRAVTITSTSGAIVDNGDAHDDIVADSGGVHIIAAMGVGSGGAIETRIKKLSIRNQAEGAVNIHEKGDLLIVGDGILNRHLVDGVPVDGGQILLKADGIITLQHGAVLESSTGRVNNFPIVLRVGNEPSDQVLVRAEPSHDLTAQFGGRIGGELGDEQGENFTIVILWDGILAPGEGRLSFIGADEAGEKIVAGQRVIVEVDPNGNIVAWIEEGTDPGMIEVLLSREFSNGQLNRVTTPAELSAVVTVHNDANIHIEDSRGVNVLNQTSGTVVTPVTGEQIITAGAIPIAFERPEVIPAREIPATPPPRPTPPRLITRYEDTAFRGAEDTQQQRKLYIVKVDADGTEGKPTALPSTVVSNVSKLLSNFQEGGLPNGLYRIYLEEPGFPRRKLMEFIKSQDTIGQPVHEPGRGSNPIMEDAVPPAARDAVPDSDADSEGRSEEEPQAAHPIRGPWEKTLDRAMEQSADKPLTKAARLCRRLHRSTIG